MTLSGMEELLIFGFLPLMIGMFAGPGRSSDAEKTLAGKLAIPPLRFVPDDAVAIVELVEQRRGETPLPVLARATIDWRGRETQKFAIRFDPALIQPMAYYALRARIVSDGTVLFETQYPQPAAPLSGNAVNIALALAPARN